MRMTSKLTTLGLLATLAAASVVPALADGYQSRSQQQTDKNNMRNLGIGAAAIAAYGLLSHNSTATLLGAAGAALAGSQYEKDRKQQSQDNNYYYRDGRNWNDDSQYRNDRYSSDSGNRHWTGNSGSNNWNNDRYGSSNNGWNSDNNRHNTDRDSDNRYDNNGNGNSNAWFHQKHQR